MSEEKVKLIHELAEEGKEEAIVEDPTTADTIQKEKDKDRKDGKHKGSSKFTAKLIMKRKTQKKLQNAARKKNRR
jgi:hypothetical protein